MAVEGGKARGGWVRSEPRSILASLPAGPGRTLRSEAHLLADINPPTPSLFLSLPPSLLHLVPPPSEPSSPPFPRPLGRPLCQPPSPPPTTLICIRLSVGESFSVEGFFFLPSVDAPPRASAPVFIFGGGTARRRATRPPSFGSVVGCLSWEIEFRRGWRRCPLAVARGTPLRARN